MGFENHAFISYAHLDNPKEDERVDPWVTRFHTLLKHQLGQRLGEEAKIWRDDRLRGDHMFAEEISVQFPHTALLVSVETPRYIKSVWCNREVREFIEAAKNTGGLEIRNQSRIKKVIKLPAESEGELASVFGEMLGYRFYEKDGETVLELDPKYGEEYGQKLHRRIAKLADEMSKTLELLANPPTGEGQADPARTVYLAECAWDRLEHREALAAELEHHGYRVLPDRPLRAAEEDYLEDVRALLPQCGLAIHLIGSLYGPVHQGASQKSIVVLQNELAAEQAKTGELTRLIWLPDGTKAKGGPQTKFVAAMQDDEEVQRGADLVTGDIEELKELMHAALERLVVPVEAETLAPVVQEERVSRVYIMCAEDDARDAIPLIQLLKKNGLKADLTPFSGTPDRMRQAQDRLLADADGLVLFYKSGDALWKQDREADRDRRRGLPGARPERAYRIVLAGLETTDQQVLQDTGDEKLIDATGGFEEEDWRSFLEELGAKDDRG